MAATIKDVAKKAGVSISTVSRVINDSKPVSTEVKQRVLDVVKELNYKPNEIARTLVTKKSYLIGVIVTDLADSYVAEMVRGIEEIGKMYNYDILLCSTFGEMEAEVKYLKLLNAKQVEGIILISDILNEELHAQAEPTSAPIVYLNRFYYRQEYHTVRIDNYKAAYEMTNYLINLGHKNVAYMSNKGDKSFLEGDKIKGYKKAISEHDNLDEIIYYSKDREIEDGYEAASELVKSDKGVTAVFCSYDELAIGTLNYLYDNDIKVPGDISVAGFGDIKTASILRPTLTTIQEPFYDIGAVAIRRIIKELLGEEIDTTDTILPFQIQERGSTRKF